MGILAMNVCMHVMYVVTMCILYLCMHVPTSHINSTIPNSGNLNTSVLEAVTDAYIAMICLLYKPMLKFP